MKVSQLITQHPGGWQDIMAMLRAKHPDVEVKVSEQSWTVDYIAVHKKGMNLQSNTKVLTHAGKIDSIVPLGKLLDMDADFPVSSTGALASMLHRMLMGLGFPVPGDKEWMKPAMTWEQKERWNYSSVSASDRRKLENANKG